jgi:thioredoxin-like negative regulator of GroEL
MTANLLARAHAAFAATDYATALREVERVLAHEPGQLQALSIKANAAIKLDDADALLEALQALHALRPDDAAIRRNLATTLNRRGNRALESGQFARAESEWRAALAVFPAHREARFNLAGSLRRAGDAQAALPIYEALDREAPEPAVSLGIADCLSDAGRDDDAAARLRATRITDDLRDSAISIATRCGAIDVADRLLASVESTEARVAAIVGAQRDAMVHRRSAEPLLARCTDPARLGERSPELQIALTRAMALPDTLLDAGELDPGNRICARLAGPDPSLRRTPSSANRGSHRWYGATSCRHHGRDDREPRATSRLAASRDLGVGSPTETARRTPPPRPQARRAGIGELVLLHGRFLFRALDRLARRHGPGPASGAIRSARGRTDEGIRDARAHLPSARPTRRRFHCAGAGARPGPGDLPRARMDQRLFAPRPQARCQYGWPRDIR